MSIKAQTYTNFEVFVVDGGSTDGSKEYLDTFVKPFSSVSEDDKGIYDAMNKGVINANGSWLLFLGADDYLASSIVLDSIFKNTIDPDICILFSKIKYELSKDNSFYVTRNKGVFMPKWNKFLWFRNTVNHQAIIYNKTLFKDNLYSLDYDILSDYYFNLKLYKKGVKYKFTNCILAVCGSNGVSKQNSWKLYKEELNLKAKLSSSLYKPVFFVLICLKFLVKKII